MTVRDGKGYVSRERLAIAKVLEMSAARRTNVGNSLAPASLPWFQMRRAGWPFRAPSRLAIEIVFTIAAEP